MTFKKTIKQFLSRRKRLSKTQEGRLRALEEIDEMRKINKTLPIEFYQKIVR